MSSNLIFYINSDSSRTFAEAVRDSITAISGILLTDISVQALLNTGSKGSVVSVITKLNDN